MSDALSGSLVAARVTDRVADGGIIEGKSPPRRRRRFRGFTVILVIALVMVTLAGAIVAWLLPETRLEREVRWAGATAIFASSYLALAIGRVPGLALDRAGAALVGAVLMVASGAISLDEAYKAVDFDTLTLLLGVMIVVAHLKLSGFFSMVGGWLMRRAHHPLVLLGSITALAGLLSAFLINDAICLVLTPLVIDVVRSMRRNPMPYLLAVATASNIGSTATITGNPQNIMIGSLSHIAYGDFAIALSPLALVGLLLIMIVIALVHRGEFQASARFSAEPPRTRTHRVLMLRALSGVVILGALLFAGEPPAKAAIIVGGLLLLTRRLKSERVYAEIDWSLLLMFAGLFIIVAGAEHTLLSGDVIAAVARLHLDSVPVLSGLTAILSNLVSNVPAVLMLKPFILAARDQHTAWIAVAMASTLAGNFTVIGSIANLIVVQSAAANGVKVAAWDYFKVGAPLTLLTLIIGTCWLWL